MLTAVSALPFNVLANKDDWKRVGTWDGVDGVCMVCILLLRFPLRRFALGKAEGSLCR